VPRAAAQRHRLRLRIRVDLVVNTFTKDALLNGKLLLHGGGWMWRPLVDVRDVSDAMIAAFEAPADEVRGEIFNVLHSNYQIRELAMLVAGSVQVMTGRRIELEETPAPKLTRDYECSNAELSTTLGFIPRHSRSFSHAELDIADVAALDRAFDEVRPDVVFNCAAFHNLDVRGAEPDQAWAVNVRAVRELALRAPRLVHLSTNYVFDGRRDAPYGEHDLPNAPSIYAITKLAGEHAALAYGPRTLVVRAAGLYGLHGSASKGGNFVQRMLTRARQDPAPPAEDGGRPAPAADLHRRSRGRDRRRRGARRRRRRAPDGGRRVLVARVHPRHHGARRSRRPRRGGADDDRPGWCRSSAERRAGAPAGRRPRPAHAAALARGPAGLHGRAGLAAQLR
jgi:nucleoside-diphosphate-sugar epimerase